MTAPVVPLAPHLLFEFTHMKHCTVLQPYTKLTKWST